MVYERIRSKLFRTHRLSIEWVRLGGDTQEVVDSLLLVHGLLERHHVNAGERVLDALIARLQQPPTASSERAA